MPLTVKEGALLGAGMMCAGASTFFYRRKATLPFKIAYFLSWPALGTGLLLAASPSPQQMEQELQQNGVGERQLEANRQLTQLQMDQLRAVAGRGRPEEQE